MPLYTFGCDTCEQVVEITLTIAQLEDYRAAGFPFCCNGKMSWRFPPSVGGHRPFKKFMAPGRTLRGVEIQSLEHIRRLEKEHSDIGLCFDHWSMDDKYETTLEHPEKFHPVKTDEEAALREWGRVKPLTREKEVDHEVQSKE